jgi:hypothetical protein
MAARLPSFVKCVYLGEETCTRKAISKAISDAGNGYLLCKCAMLCRAIGAPRSENDTAGFELPIRFSGFLIHGLLLRRDGPGKSSKQRILTRLLRRPGSGHHAHFRFAGAMTSLEFMSMVMVHPEVPLNSNGAGLGPRR